METNRHMNCILRVDTQSSGWEKSLTRVIKRVKDVSYSIDVTHGIIRISGEMNPNKVLIEIKNAGKHAELIHVECGGGGHSCYNYAYGNEYDGGYRKVEPQTYPCYEVNPRLGYLQYASHQLNGLPASEVEGRQVSLLPPPSAPSVDYDPYNPSCNIM